MPGLERRQDLSSSTGARRITSSPTASRSALRTALQPAATGGSPMPREPTGVSGSGMFQRVPLHVLRRIEDRRRLVLIEAPGERHAVVLVVDPLLADARGAMPSIERPRIWPPRLRGCMHRADVGDAEVVEQLVLAGFDVDLDLGEAGDERERLSAVAGSCRAPRPSAPARRAPSPTLGEAR